MLAVRIAEEYGAQPGPILLRDADRGWAQIQAAFLGTPDAQFDTALLTTTYRWEINDQPVSYAWKASTDYDVRIVVQNNANLYECITAGTSAGSGGPTGTDADITDGTVHWCWRKVTA